jgi:hypothetical protein
MNSGTVKKGKNGEWLPAIRISAQGEDTYSQSILASKKGKVYAAYTAVSGEIIFKSLENDQWQDWDIPQEISSGPNGSPAIAEDDNGDIHLVFGKRFILDDDSFTTGFVYLRLIDDEWLVTELPGIENHYSKAPCIDIDSEGAIHMLFSDPYYQLWHLTNRGDEWNSTMLLEAQGYCNSLGLKVVNNDVHMGVLNKPYTDPSGIFHLIMTSSNDLLIHELESDVVIYPFSFSVNSEGIVVYAFAEGYINDFGNMYLSTLENGTFSTTLFLEDTEKPSGAAIAFSNENKLYLMVQRPHLESDIYLMYEQEDNTGYENLAPLSEIKIFPNPARDWIRVKTENQIKSISLMNLNGTVLRKINFNSSLEVSIPVIDLTSGIWIMFIETTDGIYREKVMINN